jgi:hypothetical protein
MYTLKIQEHSYHEKMYVTPVFLYFFHNLLYPFTFVSAQDQLILVSPALCISKISNN